MKHSSIPIDISGLTSEIIAISAGDQFTCALTVTGGITCWGVNNRGQLGGCPSDACFQPFDVVGLSSGVRAIATGLRHTCALMNTGGVKCWGEGFALGNNSGVWDDSGTPVNVTGLSSGVTAIAAGSGFTCALTSSEGVKCWGDNQMGMMGDGTQIDRLTPVDVNGLTSGVSRLFVGDYRACAQLIAGGIKCWGENILRDRFDELSI